MSPCSAGSAMRNTTRLRGQVCPRTLRVAGFALSTVAACRWAVTTAFLSWRPSAGSLPSARRGVSEVASRHRFIASEAGHIPNYKGDFQPDEEEQLVQQKLRDHQATAPRLDAATEVRTLVEYNHGWGVMSTNSGSMPGYPSGSVVGFAPDEKGRPLMVFSSMSDHTQDLKKDSRCSITIAAKEFKGAADGRANLIGEATPIESEEERKAAREIYLKKHPKAFWIDFGDFTWYRLEVKQVRFVGGFARAGAISGKDWASAQPDPISAFAGGVAAHMNKDHRSSTVAMVRNYVGIDVDDAEIVSVDSLGMFLQVTRTPKDSDQSQQYKIRLPFIRKLNDRKDAHSVIVEMSQASAEFIPEK
ncbi:unnamed protein product [Polarella glacialis]|uniref:DUF2470 domain-containing protein n=1 Tax=Polarella glacialis TaxID=89957 RepID=A0A813ENQ3_POLGL|nr:unnamed protein product [Polarella glacialis]